MTPVPASLELHLIISEYTGLIWLVLYGTAPVVAVDDENDHDDNGDDDDDDDWNGNC